MMFSRILALTSMASLTVLAAAMPGGVKPTTTITVAPGPTSIPAGKCSTGPVQCCNQVQKANDPAMSAVLSLIGVVIQDVNAFVGLDCNPITVIGVGTGDQCNTQAVCCQDNDVGGLLSVGCIPVTI